MRSLWNPARKIDYFVGVWSGKAKQIVFFTADMDKDDRKMNIILGKRLGHCAPNVFFVQRSYGIDFSYFWYRNGSFNMLIIKIVIVTKNRYFWQAKLPNRYQFLEGNKLSIRFQVSKWIPNCAPWIVIYTDTIIGAFSYIFSKCFKI